MNSPNTPNKLVVICNKITDATNFYIPNNEYSEICDILKKIVVWIEPYVFLEYYAVDGIIWSNTIPIMGKVLDKMNELDIAQKLHHWHYQESNKPERLSELTALCKDFLNYLDSSTKNAIL
jgi:hypothetical protein